MKPVSQGSRESRWQSSTFSTFALHRNTPTPERCPDFPLTFRPSTYNYRSELTRQQTTTLRADGHSYFSDLHYDYRAQIGTGANYTGAYMGGAVTHYISYNSTDGSTLTADTQAWNSYTWWNGAQTASVAFQPDTTKAPTTLSSYYYDNAGHLQSVYIDDGRPRTVTFFTNAEGQIVERNEEDNTSAGDPEEIHYYFNGVRLGDVSNNGTSTTDYVQSIARHRAVGGTGPFAGGSTYGTPAADFDQSYDPINGLDYADAPARYTVSDGDTLTSIASQLWGDASLWYKLADANGLTGSDGLTAGQSLIVPSGVRSSSNSATTFRPYDPTAAQGDLSPTAIAPPKPQKGNDCGVFGQILLVVVAVAVTIATHGAAANFAAGIIGGGATATSAGAVIVGGALSAVAGSVASQAVGLATGIQDTFSFKGVALAAIAGGVGGALGVNGLVKDGAFSGVGGGAVVRGALTGAVSNVAIQGIALATGLQSKFDWTGVAVGASVGAGIGSVDLGGTGGRIASGLAGALAGGATRSVLTGTDFGDNILAALPDVIGSTIGELVAGAVAGLGRSGNAGYGTSSTPFDEADLDVGPLSAIVATPQFTFADGVAYASSGQADGAADLSQIIARDAIPIPTARVPGVEYAVENEQGDLVVTGHRIDVSSGYDFSVFQFRPFDLHSAASTPTPTLTLDQLDQMEASPFAAIGYGIARMAGADARTTSGAINLGEASNGILLAAGGMRGVGRPYLGNQIELDVRTAEEAAVITPKPYSNPANRPSYGSGQVNEVWANAQQNGRVFDPSTGNLLTWDRSVSRAGQWDMGHLPGQEYRVLHERYVSGELTTQEFLNEYRDPQNYRPELPSANRSRRYEGR